MTTSPFARAENHPDAVTTKLVGGPTAGLKYETIKDLDGTMQLDKLNDTTAVVLRKTGTGISLETVRDSLKRQQLVLRLLQYKVKPRKVTDEEVQAAYSSMNKSAEFEVRARDIFIRAPDGSTPPMSTVASAFTSTNRK